MVINNIINVKYCILQSLACLHKFVKSDITVK